MLATWGCTTFPKPTLSLDFLGATSLDSRITFSRGSQATLFDSTGTLRYAKHNLLLQSQTFQTTWLAVRASISSDVIAAPDGTLTADLGIEDTSTNTHNPALQDVTILANGTYTASGYFKSQVRFRGSLQFSSIDSANFAAANFNLSAGTVSTSSSGTGTVVSASITDVGNGWFRVTITGSIGSGLTTGRWILRLADASGNIAYTGDGTSGLYLWGAQLNLANMEGGVTSSLTTYYPTTTAAYYAPRFDYNPSTLQPRGLLIEEQRTNSIRNNTGQGAVAGTPGTEPTNWASSTSGVGLTREIVGVGTENGIAYIDIKFSGTPTSGTNVSIAFEGTNNVVASSGQTWTESVYVKLQAGAFTNTTTTLSLLGTNGTSGTESFASATITSTPSDLRNCRLSVTGTLANAGTTHIQPRVRIGYTAGVAFDITLRIGLPQLEQGAFATSVIPTTTTALTRNADVASMTGTNFSSWYNNAAGTLFAEIVVNGSKGSAYVIRIQDAAATNIIQIRQNIGGTQILSQAVSSGGATPGLAQTTYTVGTVYKMAVAVAPSDAAASLNGSAVSTSTAMTTMPVVDRLTFENPYYIRRLVYYPTRLPNTTLQALTA